MASTDTPTNAEIEEIISRIRESGALGERSRLSSLLEYLVTEELEGRGPGLKAYTIGTDVLGRGDDFDPTNDSIVRVEVNRLRRSLEHYSATAGRQDAYRIVVPKGSYRPLFEVQDAADETAAPAQGSQASARPQNLQWSIVSGFVLAALIIAAAILWRPISDPISAGAAVDRLEVDLSEGLSRPIINVEPFTDFTGQPDLGFVAQGLRMQIVSDLSHMHIVRVRPVDGNEDGIAALNLRPADYYLRGTIGQAGDHLRITLLLVSAASLEVVWSRVAEVGVKDQSLEAQTIDSVQDIVRLMAGPNGFIPMRQLDWLEERLSNDGEETAARPIGAHECHLRWHAYDQTKDPAQGEITRQCLNDLVSIDTSEASIWAAHGFLTFLDWSRAGDQSDETQLEQATADVIKAIQLDPFNAEGHEYLASILMAKGDHEGARDSYRRAVKLNPSKPDLRVLQGWAEILGGAWDDGIVKIQQGMTLTTNPPGWFRIPLSMNAFRLEDYERALSQAELIVLSGDQRGVPLALAPAIRLGSDSKVQRLQAALDAEQLSAEEALEAVRTVLNDPELIDEYLRTLNRIIRYN
ncbi:MAG: tetratricopeptide repeat protein [Alphaproteobacteria bacterium]|nr:tetratricopeptide repeat protein [Alphaproteobacteria bacterium SS10]